MSNNKNRAEADEKRKAKILSKFGSSQRTLASGAVNRDQDLVFKTDLQVLGEQSFRVSSKLKTQNSKGRWPRLTIEELREPLNFKRYGSLEVPATLVTFESNDGRVDDFVVLPLSYIEKILEEMVVG